MPRETGWAIVGKAGLYTGWNLTRASIIAEHVAAIYSGRCDFGDISQFAHGRSLDADQARAWSLCREAGDRAVKVTLSYKT